MPVCHGQSRQRGNGRTRTKSGTLPIGLLTPPAKALTSFEIRSMTFNPLAQLKEKRKPFRIRIGLDDHLHNLAALVPQPAPRDILEVADEVPHDLPTWIAKFKAFL